MWHKVKLQGYFLLAGGMMWFYKMTIGFNSSVEDPYTIESFKRRIHEIFTPKQSKPSTSSISPSSHQLGTPDAYSPCDSSVHAALFSSPSVFSCIPPPEPPCKRRSTLLHDQCLVSTTPSSGAEAINRGVNWEFLSSLVQQDSGGRGR